jgi:hypothetical protein
MATAQQYRTLNQADATKRDPLPVVNPNVESPL